MARLATALCQSDAFLQENIHITPLLRGVADIHSRNDAIGALRARFWRGQLAVAAPRSPAYALAMPLPRPLTTRRAPVVLIAAALLLGAAAPVPLPPAPAMGFADLADLTLAAPVIVRATITDARPLGKRDAPDVTPGRARLLVTARTDAALVAPSPVGATLSWLWDVPLDARGKPPRPRQVPVLAFLAPPDVDGRTRLIALAGQLPWSEALETRVRALVTAQRAGDVPEFVGIANGFRADGTVPGESESQFFLSTRGGGTVALVVTARPGEPRRVAIARGDVIDESAARVRADTLLQYRLACFLPRRLPAGIGSDAALAADWQAALVAIGPCDRKLPRG